MKSTNSIFLIKEPLTIPQPGKLPEIEPFQDPILPKVYPDENPIEVPQTEPIEKLPFILPSPSEFKLNI